MDAAEVRRRRIIDMLGEAREPITGSELANSLLVSRQIIVQDIALLRAGGKKILATPQGYMLLATLTGTVLTYTIAACHGSDDLRKELEIIVDAGGKILDVIVEHPLYGELKCLLMISSRGDIEKFIHNLSMSKAQPLSALTDGVHLHTIEVADKEVFLEIERKLAKAGILLQKGEK